MSRVVASLNPAIMAGTPSGVPGTPPPSRSLDSYKPVVEEQRDDTTGQRTKRTPHPRQGVPERRAENTERIHLPRVTQTIRLPAATPAGVQVGRIFR